MLYRRFIHTILAILSFSSGLITSDQCQAQLVDWSWSADMDSIQQHTSAFAITQNSEVISGYFGLKSAPFNAFGQSIIPHGVQHKTWVFCADSNGLLQWYIEMDQINPKGDSLRFMSIEVRENNFYATSVGGGLIEVSINGAVRDTLDFSHLVKNYTFWKFNSKGEVLWARNLYDTAIHNFNFIGNNVINFNGYPFLYLNSFL